MGRRGYPAEFRRKVPHLVESGRPVADAAKALGITDRTSCSWRRQDHIDKGLEPGLTAEEESELAATEQRVAALEAELAVHRRASELLGKVVPQNSRALRPQHPPCAADRRSVGSLLVPYAG